VKLTYLLSKGQRKLLVIEFIIIFSLFIGTSFLFCTYLSEYHKEYSNLVTANNDPDYEVQADQRFSSYLLSHSSFVGQFGGYKYQSIVNIPKSLVNVQVKNNSFDKYNLILINSEINEAVNADLHDNEIMILLRNSDEIQVSDISINWNFYVENESLSVINIVNETFFKPAFSSMNNLLVNHALQNFNIIIYETFFFKIAQKVSYNTLLNIAALNTTSLFSFFRWNKTEYLNSLPKRVQEAHDIWTNTIRNGFLQFYGFFDEISGPYAQIDFNDIFADKVSKLTQKMNAVFISTSIIALIISSIFLFTTYNFLKQSQTDLRRVLKSFSEKGASYSTLSRRIIFLHILVSLFCLIFSLCVSFSFLFINKINRWSYSNLLIIIVHLIVIFLISFFQFRLNSAVQLKETLREKRKRTSYSKSEIISVIIQSSAILVIVLTITVFWTINKTTLGSGGLTTGAIWLISLGILSFTTLLLFTPRILPLAVKRVVNKLLSLFTDLYSFITRLFTSIYRSKKQAWLLSFYLLFFTSFLTLSYSTLQNHQEQLYLSAKLGDATVIIDSDSVSDVIKIGGKENCVVSYFDTVSTVKGVFYMLYLNNPLKFYENAFFATECFQEMENYEVFNLLNSSSDYFITSSLIANAFYYSIGDNVSIPRTSHDFSINYENKILLDIAKYLPFYFPTGEINWYVMKQDILKTNDTHYQFAYISIKKDNNNIEDLIFFLDEQKIWYSINEYDEDVFSIENTNESFAEGLKLPVIFINITIPAILALILLDIQKISKEQFSYLNLRGLKKSVSAFAISNWFSIHILLTIILTMLISILGLQIILFIKNSSYGLPVTLNISCVFFITPLILIILTLVVPYSSSLLPRIIGQKQSSKFIAKGDNNE
jgi:hypothetical protein